MDSRSLPHNHFRHVPPHLLVTVYVRRPMYRLQIHGGGTIVPVYPLLTQTDSTHFSQNRS